MRREHPDGSVSILDAKGRTIETRDATGRLTYQFRSNIGRVLQELHGPGRAYPSSRIGENTWLPPHQSGHVGAHIVEVLA